MYYNEIAAAFIVRVFLGIIFFAQGFDKVFNIKVRNVYDAFEYPLHSKHLPSFVLRFASYYTSYIELTGGFLLIIGLFKSYVLYFLGADLLFVAIAFGMINPVWDMQHVFRRLVLLISLLLTPSSWDVISLDHLIQKLNT